MTPVTDQASRRLPLALFGVGGVLMGLVAFITLFPRQQVRTGRPPSPARQNLRLITLALMQYHDEHHALPPAIVYDLHGRALYSWRVLLLPYLEEDKLSQEFWLDEPWNSPHNLQLLPRMPPCFRPVGKAETAPPGYTPYQVLVGIGTAFEDGRRLRIPDDFPDGTSKTIAVVEAQEVVPWTAPLDLPYAPDRPLPKLGSSTEHGFNAAMVDCSVRFVGKEMSAASVRAGITRNAGDKPGPDWDK